MNAVGSPFTRLVAISLLALALAACDTGGPATQSNPNLTTSAGGYAGPAARTADILSFQNNFWQFLKEENRCGQCHGTGTSPEFVDPDDVNTAYSQAIGYVDLQSPVDSVFVTKVGGGHNCWQASTNACADSIESMIVNWADASNITSKRLIQLTAPATLRDPGDAKSFPATATTAGTNGMSFADTVHELLIGSNPPIANDNCQNCHEEIATPLPQAPFFASGDVNSAYEAAKSKMNIDSPADSRFVARLDEGHNCWSDDCVNDAQAMIDAIADFADGIEVTPIDTALVTSKAMTLLADGIVASGGNRHESNQIAIWEFKTATGTTAYDTSGIDPSMDLALLGSHEWWQGGYGLRFSGGRAFAGGIASDKINNFVQATGQFAIEAWVIPDNVTQEDANIVSYSGSATQRNFTLGQDMYDYEFFNRVDDGVNPPDANGEPFLSTGGNGDEFAQSSLQHVVANFHPIDGRSIYVNGELVNVTDPVAGPVTVNNVWDDSFGLVIGNENPGGRPWSGSVRMVALHNRVLNQEQVTQNFDIGVGEKYFLLFSIAHRINIPDTYIYFEVSQFDNYGYLFARPTFVNLDPDWTPTPVDIAGIRIGINGKQAVAGQAFANINVSVDPANYDPALGYLLSEIGTVISLEKGAGSDEFFLTFENIGAGGSSQSHAFVDIDPPVPADPPLSADVISSDIGVRTFEEIHSTIAAITGVPITNPVVEALYLDYIQQLPGVEAIGAFLPSHQMAIAQLAITSCSELVNGNGDITAAAYFPSFGFGVGAQDALDTPAERNLLINPLLTAVMNVDIANAGNNLDIAPDDVHPAETTIRDLLGSTATQDLDAALAGDSYESLITQLLVGAPNTTARTAQIVKAVCGASVAGAVMLVQ